MKKLFFLATVIFLLTGALPAMAVEEIDDFSAEIRINKDSSLDITETITYDFGDQEKHGIYRKIPYKYDARGGNFTLKLSVSSVTDENGNQYDYTVSNEAGNKVIKIGDADKVISGVHIYKISYRVKRAINYFADHDELYWNATGNEWEVPIRQSKAEVLFPENVSLEKLKSNCYAGIYGTENNCISDRFTSGGEGLASGVTFAHDILTPNGGLTVVVGLPKGILNQPSAWVNAWDTFKDNSILLLPFLTMGLMIYLWRRYGRDPRGRGTIIAEFDPPDNLTPAEIGTLIDEKAGQTDISAEIIFLATKGYLKINRIEKQGLFKQTDYELERLKDSADLANEFDKKLLDSLFPDNRKLTDLSSLKNEFYKDLEEIKKMVYESLNKKDYFKRNPKSTRITYLVIGILVGFLGILAGSLLGGLAVFSFITSGLIIVIFSFFMPAKTATGVLAREHILGLKTYLSVAEKDRINFHNAPEKKPERFEKLLPFAMVLGVEKAWARQFEGIYNGQPSWYNDPSGANFSAIMLANSLSSFQSKSNSTLASAPSSASSGGSGFSGGFSGGGFGGGGGGSW